MFHCVIYFPEFRRKNFANRAGYVSETWRGGVAKEPWVKTGRDEIGPAKFAQRPRVQRFENDLRRNEVAHLRAS